MKTEIKNKFNTMSNSFLNLNPEIPQCGKRKKQRKRGKKTRINAEKSLECKYVPSFPIGLARIQNSENQTNNGFNSVISS